MPNQKKKKIKVRNKNCNNNNNNNKKMKFHNDSWLSICVFCFFIRCQKTNAIIQLINNGDDAGVSSVIALLIKLRPH